MLHAVRHPKPVYPWTADSDLAVAGRVDRRIALHQGHSRTSLAGKPGEFELGSLP